ncbi:MAG: hypothetical protein HY360_01210, partial [Verrucomicrobia bacterium]|nr:hypothetical protein [Verrucomicrobiota bacterium]
IGQRKGINVGSPRPLYVLDIDAGSHRVTVGDDDDLWRANLRVDRVIWGKDGPPAGKRDVMVKIRHSHEAAPASMHPEEDGRVRIRFRQPQRAITPGQAAVFYDGDTVLGGGWIMRTCEPRNTKPQVELIAS